MQILSHCPYTLEVSKAMAEGGNACWESQVRWLHQEDLPAGLLSGPHWCLRAPARSNSDLGQQLPFGLKVPFSCPQLVAWLLTSSVWTTQGLIHGRKTHTQKDTHLIQFPAIAVLKSFLLFWWRVPTVSFCSGLVNYVSSLDTLTWTWLGSNELCYGQNAWSYSHIKRSTKLWDQLCVYTTKLILSLNLTTFSSKPWLLWLPQLNMF